MELEMILISAGDFLMGSNPSVDKEAYDNEQPQHRLYLPDYYIAKTPVTNAQYAAFVQATGHRAPSVGAYWAKSYNWSGQTPPKGKENHPVVLISWNDAVAYCKWLSVETGRQHRLPTEAEWEKAARGVDGRIYPWGNCWDAKRCNTNEGEIWETTPVGTYPNGASPYGLLDMAGNVWEWCATTWGKTYPYDVENEWSEKYLEVVRARVLRGGGWLHDENHARAPDRFYVVPDVQYEDIGFRCAHD